MKQIFLIISIFTIHISFAQSLQDERFLLAGDQSFLQTNFDDALRNYNYHIENNPFDPVGYLHRARLYEATGRVSESRMDNKVALDLNPLSLMYVSPEARSKHSAKKTYAFDYNDLDEAFIKSPSKTESYDKILDELSLSHSQDSVIQAVVFELNNININEAERLLQKIEVTNLNKGIIHDLYGKIYLKRMEYNKAIDSFTKAIQENPQFSIAYHNRSVCYKLIGDLKKAEQDLKTAINLNDDISMFYFTYAKLNEKNGQDKLAIKNYTKAIEIDEDYKEALINYGQLLKGLGDYSTGLQLLNEAITNDESAIENIFYKANLHFVYGDFQEAINDYETYLRSQPEDGDALYNKGLSMILMRSKSEGCAEIENSLSFKDVEKRRYLYEMFCNDM